MFHILVSFLLSNCRDVLREGKSGTYIGHGKTAHRLLNTEEYIRVEK